MREFQARVPIGSNMMFARGVLLLDDCDGTLGWVASGTGGDDVHAFSTDYAFSGVNSLKLVTRTTGAAAGDTLTVARVVEYPESGLLVYRARVLFLNKARIDQLWVQEYCF